MTARRLIGTFLAVVLLAGCSGANAPTPCVVSYPPAIGANVIVYFPDVTDAQCPGTVDAVPGAARLLAVPTGEPLCSGSTALRGPMKVYGDSPASHALCIGLQSSTPP